MQATPKCKLTSDLPQLRSREAKPDGHRVSRVIPFRPLRSSCLCGESYRAGFAEIQINPGGTMGTEISEEEFYQASVFIVSLR